MIMRQLGIRGLPAPKKRTVNLVNLATEEDLVHRNFVARGSNELWLTDITQHPTLAGKVYCCVVLDLFSRKVVGWAIDRHRDSTPVNEVHPMGQPHSVGTAGFEPATSCSQTLAVHATGIIKTPLPGTMSPRITRWSPCGFVSVTFH